MKYFMGIDPGATRAAAFVREDGVYCGYFDWPGSASALVNTWDNFNPYDPAGILGPGKTVVELAVLELVHPMPKQGVSSTGKFMKNAGIWEGFIAANKIPYELITPQRWRKILDSSVPHKPEKEDLRLYAIRRFPEAGSVLTRKGDHGRAEAILMALYALQKSRGLIN